MKIELKIIFVFILVGYCNLLSQSIFQNSRTDIKILNSKDGKAYLLNKVEDSLFQDFRKNENINFQNLIAIKKNRSKNIPNLLKRLFKDTNSMEARERIAHALIFFGENDSEYYNFLINRVQQVVFSDMPLILSIDSKCVLQKGVNPEFRDWSKKNNLDSITSISLYNNYLTRIYIVSSLAAPQFSPSLMKILMSKNPVFELLAIEGLAKINDTNFVDPIIKCIRNQKDCDRAVFSVKLIYFKNEKAITEAKRNLGRALYEEVISRFKKNGLKDLYGYEQ